MISFFASYPFIYVSVVTALTVIAVLVDVWFPVDKAPLSCIDVAEQQSLAKQQRETDLSFTELALNELTALS